MQTATRQSSPGQNLIDLRDAQGGDAGELAVGLLKATAKLR